MEWAQIRPFEQAAGKIGSWWLVHEETLPGYTHLRLKAAGKWRFIAGSSLECGPDGALDVNMTDGSLLIPGSPAACLIGKLGGSTASLSEAEGAAGQGSSATETPGAGPVKGIFAIGAFCVLELPPKTVGPLLIGFNLRARPIEIVEPIRIEIGGGTFG